MSILNIIHIELFIINFYLFSCKNIVKSEPDIHASVKTAAEFSFYQLFQTEHISSHCPFILIRTND